MEKIVYHGSPDGNIKVLKPHMSTHQKDCIYATYNKVVSFLFMGKGNGDLDKRISHVDGKIELVERRPGILEQLYNKGGYLYELDGSTFDHYDFLWSQEVISYASEIKPLNVTYYPCILDAINEEEKKSNIIVYRYPDRPENVPLDNSDLIEKYINFEKQGLKGSIDRLLAIYPEFKEYINTIDESINKR